MGERLRVVVADDNEMVRQFVRQSITQLGHDVIVVEDGGALVGACKTFDPHFVLSDVEMPELDGITALSAIRRWSSIPVVLMSGGWDDATRKRATLAGATRCIAKPFCQLDLISILEECRAERSRRLVSDAVVRQIIEGASGYAVVALAAEGRIVFWNHGAEKLFGVPVAGAVGKSWGAVLGHGGAPTADELYAAERCEQAEWGWWHTRECGARAWLAASVVPVRVPDGEPVVRGLIVRDATGEAECKGRAQFTGATT